MLIDQDLVSSQCTKFTGNNLHKLELFLIFKYTKNQYKIHMKRPHNKVFCG